MTLEHHDRVELELAKCRDEMKRTRLQLARAISLAEDIVYCLNNNDESGARFNATCILTLEESG